MKFLFDYFPIVLFFIAYRWFGVFPATWVIVCASVAQLAVYWIVHRRLEKFHVISAACIVFFGGLTLFFKNPIFIQLKPSMVYWIFALTLWISPYFSSKTLLHHLLSEKISLPPKIWNRLNLSWSIFFLLLGALNVYVVYHWSLKAWVHFKLFGTLGCMFVFIIAQTVYIMRHNTHDAANPMT